MSKLRLVLLFLSDLISYAPIQFTLSCSLVLLNTLCAGAGLLLLIPLLQYAGWMHGNEMRHTALIIKQTLLPHFHTQLPLLFTLLLFVTLISLFASLEYISSQCMTRLQRDYLYDLQKKLNTAVANTRWSYLLKQQLTYLEHILFSGFLQMNMLTHFALQTVNASIIITVFLAFSFCISWQLTWVTLAAGLVIFFLSSRHRATALGQKSLDNQKQLHEMLMHFLYGLKLAKSYNNIPAYVAYFNTLSWENSLVQRQFAKDARQVKLIFRISSALIFSIVFYIAYHFLHICFATLITLLLIFSRLFPQVSLLQQSTLQILHLSPLFLTVQTLLQNHLLHQETMNTNNVIALHRQIVLSHLDFCYNENNVLTDINCRFQVNKITAIVGRSGAGKSTLADLLLGLLTSTNGCIFIDDIVLTENNLTAWRSIISYVPQEPFFFNSTIRANLLWAAPDAGDTFIWEILKLAAADRFVGALPNQLDFMMGDRGIHLSGGERQRLAFARALLRKPSVLLLDEATSALDSYHEDIIYQTINKLKNQMTIILIAHRFSTIRAADHIIVLEAGKVVEQGNLQTLSNPQSYFAGIVGYKEIIQQSQSVEFCH